jgi:hypothetical protein
MQASRQAGKQAGRQAGSRLSDLEWDYLLALTIIRRRRRRRRLSTLVTDVRGGGKGGGQDKVQIKLNKVVEESPYGMLCRILWEIVTRV